jgi:uncharacterized protein YpbB
MTKMLIGMETRKIDETRQIRTATATNHFLRIIEITFGKRQF